MKNITRAEIESHKARICYAITSEAGKRGIPSHIFSKNRVAVSFKNGENAVFHVTYRGEGLSEGGSTTHTFRIGTASFRTEHAIAKTNKDTFFKSVWCSREVNSDLEASFLFDETDEVVAWILDNFLTVEKNPVFPLSHPNNVKVGNPPGYFWTKAGWEAVFRKDNKDGIAPRWVSHE